MVRSELVAALARENPGLSAEEVSRLVDAFFETIVGQLARGGRVEFRGFGTFSTREREPSMVRNPQTGAMIPKPGCRVAHFRASRAMGSRLNSKVPGLTTDVAVDA